MHVEDAAQTGCPTERLCCRPSHDQFIADIGLHFTTVLGNDPVHIEEESTDQASLERGAMAFRNPRRAFEVDEKEGPFLLDRSPIASSQDVDKSLRADQADQVGTGPEILRARNSANTM